MAEVNKRKTITVDLGCWQKYCDLKADHLRDLGTPELCFTEFVNAVIRYSNLTVQQVLDFRREKAATVLGRIR